MYLYTVVNERYAFVYLRCTVVGGAVGLGVVLGVELGVVVGGALGFGVVFGVEIGAVVSGVLEVAANKQFTSQYVSQNH